MNTGCPWAHQPRAALLQPAKSRGENGKILCFLAAPPSLLQSVVGGSWDLETRAPVRRLSAWQGTARWAAVKELQDGDGRRGVGWGWGKGGTTSLKFALRSIGSAGKVDKAPWPSSALSEPTHCWHWLQSSLGLKSTALCPLLPALNLAAYLKTALYFKLFIQAWFPHTHTSLSLPLLSFFFLFFKPHKSYFSIWKALAFTRGCCVFPRTCGPQTGTDAAQGGRGMGCLWLPGA